MTDHAEQDRQWLIDQGYPKINATEFSDRVTRDMAQNNVYDCVQVVRDQVLAQMISEQ
jgi:hypothetical protein